jgi:hypothetical protein
MNVPAASLLGRLVRGSAVPIRRLRLTNQLGLIMSSAIVLVRLMAARKITASKELEYEVSLTTQWLEYTHDGGAMSFETWKAWKEEELEAEQ